MYSRHRFPVEIISYCVLYYTFPLSYRDIERVDAARAGLR